MKFDVIITTYNRPDDVFDLAKQISQCPYSPSKLIVVDSSDIVNHKILKLSNVVYLQASHKNQPYQRYLGYLATSSEIVIFMDDDVKIINDRIFNIIVERYKDSSIVGSNVNFRQDGIITIQKENGLRTISKENSKLARTFWWITGVPLVRDGKIWLAGLTGNDSDNNYTESFGGPGTLSFRREIVPFLFDDLLFSLFEKKMAMGEDKYISMGALPFGRLAYNQDLCISHPANESTYFQDIESFVRKEMYSRLFLSKRYVEVKKKWIGWAYLHYYWFAVWRIVIAFYFAVFQSGVKNTQKLKGKIKGVLDTIRKPLRANLLCPGVNWQQELVKDKNRSIF